mgnify:CR=1 FL=1
MPKLLNRQTTSWCLYDWGSSAYSTIVNTFVLAAYFSQAVASNHILGTSQWGYATALAALLTALISPFLGSIADHRGNARFWFNSLNVFVILGIAAWWWVKPGTTGIAIALSLCFICNFCYETAFVLYNGMLKNIAPASHVGRLSAWGYALGYAGGTVCLIVVLFLLINNSFNIAFLKTDYHAIRLVGPVTAIWYLLFCLPVFLHFKPVNTTLNKTYNIKNAWQDIVNTLKTVRQQSTLFTFLLARLFFIDGLNTIFAFAGIYAAGTFGMSTKEIMYIAIGSQIFALIGAWSFAKLDDKIGPLTCLRIALCILMLMILGLVFAESHLFFWIFAMGLSLTIGPIQSCSRSYIIRISDPEIINKNFGFFTLSGKITAFIGPWMVALTTSLAQNQRAGIVPVLLLVAIGYFILIKLKK